MFQFKQFTIRQDRTAMKVGTDGVLLGAWFDPGLPAPHILDIGTGTGLIALMAAQRFPKATVDAIEIDPEAAAQATDNVQISPFSSRISVYNVALQNWGCTSPADTVTLYDTIVSNPPYFDNSLRCPDTARSTARHTDTLSDQTLIHHSARLLKPGGTLNLVLPYAKKDGFIALLQQNRFTVYHITEVYPTPTSAPKRILISARHHPTNTNPATSNNNLHTTIADTTHTPTTINIPTLTTDTITIELERHHYTPDYIALTHPFYLKM